MAKNIQRVKFSIKSTSLESMTRKMLELNRVNDKPFDFSNPIFINDGKSKFYLCWYYADAKTLIRNVK